jgi:dTDP-4-dehydrorhamnose 3,5-epimerase
MRFLSGALAGVRLIEPQPHSDERGSFLRIFCEQEFAEHGLPERFVQSSLSHNTRAGTVRGLHFQWPPSVEGKLVRCVAGAVHDAFVDLRPDSPTFMRHLTVELSAENGRAVYLPPGFAHGFQALADGATVLYQMTAKYEAAHDGGFAFGDPAFAIEWPLPVSVASDRDRNGPAFDPVAYRTEYARRALSRPGASLAGLG